MLSRNKIYQKLQTQKDAKKVYIFCEGDRKKNYFNYFRGLSSNIEIIPLSNVNGRSDPDKLFKDAQIKFYGDSEQKPKFIFQREFKDEVWFVIDTDGWNSGNKIECLRRKCLKEANWNVSQSNPCFEIWLYFHFYDQTPTLHEIPQFSSFKDFLFSKISGGFDNRKHPIYFQTAIFNSQKNFEVENNQPKYLSTEVSNVANSILHFTKEIIDQLLEFNK